ncbi:hypothetical protein TD95_004731 [Thielaviopsis punctulata]|uniref:Vacuolar protein sorting-associated protein n=1 Tax=Thielaviopsis punctulata TaxID=72032 RepID=A0A0F4ZAR1_9PEZI|nr:hypothetical protein TD95_004731 [Thielaviopsis punctulata]
MLEGLVAGILNRFLGMYVKDFDPGQLKVGIWSGDVKLRDLELRREALDQLKLPINVFAGHLGELTLVIPWSNLRGSPVKIMIEDVFLLASPKEESNYDADEEDQRRQRLKMERLESAEMLRERNREGMSQEEEQKTQSFTQSLITKIMDNLQIHIKNIHIRYEDSISAPGHPFALGVTLQEFSAITTDAYWKPMFVQDSRDTTHKLASLEALSVYWNTDTDLMGTGRDFDPDRDELLPHLSFVEKCKLMIATHDNASRLNHQYILRPVTGQAKLRLDKTGDTHIPRFHADLLFDEIGLVIDDDQYRDGLMMVDLFHYFTRRQEYLRHQPKVPVMTDARAWFRFAGNAVLNKIHERNRKWTWDYFRKRRDNRVRYISLFKKSVQSATMLEPDEQAALQELEFKLTYEDLRFWRSLARNQMRKERNLSSTAKQLERTNTLQPQLSQPQQQSGWMSWVWGSKPAEDSSQDQEATENTHITEEQRKELYEAIDWDEHTALTAAIDVPRDSVKLQVETSLRTGSFTLRQRQQADHSFKELMSLHFDAFRARMLQRPDSFLAQLTLGGFRVKDGTTADSLYPEIVRVKDASSAGPGSSSGFGFGSDNSGDTGFSNTRASLEFALEEHKAINANFDLQAPLIIIPLSISTPNSQCLIVDAGHINVASKLVDKDTMDLIQAKQRQAYTDEDLRRLESVMYDSFSVKLSSTQVLVGPSVEVAKQQLADETNSLKLHIVDRINIDLSVEICILPKAPNLTKMKVSGHLPMLHATISDQKYKTLMKAIEVAIPKLGGPPPPPAPPSSSSLGDDSFVDGGGGGINDQSDARSSRRGSHASFMSALEHPMPAGQSLGRRPSLFLSVPGPAIIEDDLHMDDVDSEGDDTSSDSNNNEKDQDENKNKSPSSSSSSTHVSQQLKLQQRNFQFSFKVDYLKGSLCRSDPTGKNPDQLLVEMTAEDFNILFYNRPYDMVAQVSLGSVTLDDFVVEDTPAQFKAIVSSGDNEDLLENRSLVQITFTRISRESPEFLSVWEGVETSLSVSVSTINLIVTRKTLLTLLDFVLATFTDNGATPSPPQPPPPPAHDRPGFLGLRRLSIMSRSSEMNQPPLGVGGLSAGGPGFSSSGLPANPPQPSLPTNISPSAPPPSMKIKAQLKSIRLILNNDGVRLATFALNHADVGLVMIGPVMRLHAKLGDFSLVDDINTGVSERSPLRRLISVHGDELADFRYETFDANNVATFPGYDSSVYFRAGSIKVTFIEEPFRNIFGFLVKFGQMQALYNAARQAAASQATQIQRSNTRMKYDVVISTPIVSFPRAVSPGRHRRDVLLAYLGEIYASNRFVPVTKGSSDVATVITAGIRNIRLTSDLSYSNDQSEELEMIDHVDVNFKVTSLEHRAGSLRPDMEIEGSMSDFNLRLTQYQVQFLLEVSRSVPAAFAGGSQPEGEAQEEEESAPALPARPAVSVHPALPIRPALPSSNEEAIIDDDHDDVNNNKGTPQVSLAPELPTDDSTWTRLDLVFKVNTIGLDLIMAEEDKPVGDVKAASLSRFSLDESQIKFKMVSDGSMEAELLIQSFTIHDLRAQDKNKFRRIMSSRSKSVKQLMSTVTISGGGNQDRTMIMVVTLDSPRLIFALDYLFAVNKFLTVCLQPPSTAIDADMRSILDSQSESDADSVAVTAAGATGTTMDTSTLRTGGTRASSAVTAVGPRPSATPTTTAGSLKVVFRINVIDSQLILIADPLTTSSEAIVLGTRQVLLSKQNAITFQVSEVSMFLCKMDRFDSSRLRVLDDFSLQMAMESSQANKMMIDLTVDPLILRLSFRDIYLVLQILARASELSNDEPAVAAAIEAGGQDDEEGQGRPKTGRSVSGSAVAARQASSATASASAASAAIIKPDQHLKASFSEIRLVLIGEGHELPILDTGLQGGFTATVDNWSTDLRAGVTIETYANVYNFSKSAWEPLIEPWQAAIGVDRDASTGQLNVAVDSAKTFDVTITTATVQLAMTSMGILSRYEQQVEKPRGGEAPYRIRNYTGFDISVTAQNAMDDLSVAASASGPDDKKDVISAHLSDGQEIPWSFERWEKMREMLSSDERSAMVTITLDGSGFEPIRNVHLNREGEFLFALRPRMENVVHRLMVEVVLEADYVKYVTIRSPMVFENKTQIPLEIGVFDTDTGHLLKIEKVAPGAKAPAPVGAAYSKSMLLRPDSGFGYEWSTATLGWRDMMAKPTRTIVCKGGETAGDLFYFQVSAQYDKANPLVRNYPYLTVKIYPPITLENLLPHDFKYRIYDKNTKRDWSNFLRKGGISPIHVVELSHLLLLNIDMQDSVFKPSDFAIINSGSSSKDFSQEHRLVCRDVKGLNLTLNLLYEKMPGGGGAFKVIVYTPYVILNKTGMELLIRARGFMQSAKVAAGQQQTRRAQSQHMVRAGHDDQQEEEEEEEDIKAQPLMFSFGNDDHRNRAFLKLAGSDWSKPQSFDAVGSSTEVVVPAAAAEFVSSSTATAKDSEISIGVAVESGVGKYQLTKIVTISPRFIVINKLSEELQAREPSSSGLLLLKPHMLEPLRFMGKSATKQLCLGFPGLNNPWSSPFNLSDLGTTHIKLSKAGQRQKLVRVDILMEGATIFIHLVPETGNWPFSMRNESSVEFTFWQANPFIDEDGIEMQSGWKPIKYRLPARSIMPYAWDFPAANVREVIISPQTQAPTGGSGSGGPSSAAPSKGLERHVQLSEIGTQLPMKFNIAGGQQKIIDISVAADGPTQTLILSNYKPSRSMYRRRDSPRDRAMQQSRRDSYQVSAQHGRLARSSTSSSTSSASGFEVKQDHETAGIIFSAQLNFSGMGISLINASHKELAYITFRGVQLRYTDSQLYQTASMAVKWIQIDNQLYGGLFPILLFPSVVPKKTKEIEAHPSLHMMLTRVKDESYGLLYVKYATVLLQEMTIELDEDFLFALIEFANSGTMFLANSPAGAGASAGAGVAFAGDSAVYSSAGGGAGPGAGAAPAATALPPDVKLCEESLDIPQPQMQQAGQDMYFEVLNIQPMQLNISFMRTQVINSDSQLGSRNPLMFFINMMTMTIGNVNDAPIRFNALLLENVRVSVPVLLQNVTSHYAQEALYQVHKILGSADFLGNPVGLFNNISSGITDIFYEPYQGLILSDNPEEFTLGLAKGATSFLKKSVYGFSDSFSKVTGSVAKGLALATLDKQFQDRRRITRARNRPKHALYGVTAGANSFITSVASGVGGLAKKPWEGAEQEGALGFLKGVGKGFIGLATKPAIGVLDLASNVSEGIRNTTTVFDGSELEQVRKPRFIPADGIVRPYNAREALGQYWLKQVDNGRFFDEQYIAHLELPREDLVVLITFSRILVVWARKLNSEWDIPLKDIQTISKERTGMSVVLRGGENGPFIPVTDESGRAFLYRMVAIAVEEFNRKFRTM